MVSLEEMKNYLRIDYEDDDELLKNLLTSAIQLCMDIARIEDEDVFANMECGRTAVMYTVAYLYEHREDADHHALTMTLRFLLFGIRREGF